MDKIYNDNGQLIRVIESHQSKLDYNFFFKYKKQNSELSLMLDALYGQLIRVIESHQSKLYYR